MSNDEYVNEASTSRCKRQLKYYSNHSNRRREAEIKLVEGRLKILEEEAEMLKEAVEESRKIIGDIQDCMLQLQREVGRGDQSYSHGMEIVSHHKVSISISIYVSLAFHSITIMLLPTYFS